MEGTIDIHSYILMITFLTKKEVNPNTIIAMAQIPHVKKTFKKNEPTIMTKYT